MSAVENPPAFPLGVPHMTEYQPEWGMSLRDWFAGQALAMSQPDKPAYLADWAYRVADAMLLARSQQSSVAKGGEAE